MDSFFYFLNVIKNFPYSSNFSSSSINSSSVLGDSTAKRALLKFFYSERIKLIEKTAMEADRYLYGYIIKGITEVKSYTYLKTVLGMPCGKDMYYDRYRKFFWLLSNSRRKHTV